MSFWDDVKNVGAVALAPVTGGASLTMVDDEFGHKLPVIGGFYDDPTAEEKQRMLHRLALAYQAQRPELAQSQTNALNQTLGAYAPSNEMIGKMYGKGAMADLEALGKNPMTPNFMNPGVGQIGNLQNEIDRTPRKPTSPKPVGA